uniref:Death-associated kinase 1 isoform X2 n=1 Tax=Tetranychus evansi TaxID=178897 RepID=A0A3G5APK9_9ACAR|nr:death-associated kinase 1 isoform X2 [Tetranychus evansi]
MKQFKSEPIEMDYIIAEEIGSGQFATVRRCIERSSGKEFAAKFVRKKRIIGSRRGLLLEDIEREVNILKKLNHDNIVKLYNVYDNGNEVILILELVKGGELFDYLAGKEGLAEAQAIAFIKQILLGLDHMHSKNIVHLDLKPENIMLLDKETQRLKLIDFGLSRVVNTGSDIREILGTPEFVAPEIINYEPITLATDLWSVGVITYNLLSGASPFLGDTKQETFANITAVDYFFDSTHFSDLAQNFISNLLVKDGRKRLTVEQCLQHDWLKQNDTYLLSETVIQSTNNYQPQLINIKARNRWKLAYEVIKTCIQLARPIGEDENHHESINSLVNSFPNHFYNEKQQDENFVLAALFGAVEEGNLNGLQELVNMSKIDINQANTHGETVVHVAAGLGQLEILKLLIKKGADFTLVDNHGDSAIYWAARQGHTQIIRYLYEKGLNVDSKNKAGETAVHVAARYGHADAIEQLCKCGANVNVADDHGETALHIAVWHGFPRIVHVLGEVGAQANVKNKEDETALHCAAARGHIESVRCLLEIGVDLNLLDKNGCTALHLSLRRHHIVVALMLINGGANFEIADSIGERPIHIVAREGLLSVCQALCSLNCSVNVCNKSGLYPIHLAAKNGHIEIVRTLCLTSCTIDQKNRDGITAEISALAQGYKDIADLLVSIKNETIRSDYIQSLMPSSEPLTRIKLKLLGHSGVGKTTLVESLKCGYFSSWFRRSSRGVTTVAASAVVASLPSIGKRSVLSKNSMSSSKSSLDASPPLTPTTATSSSSSSAGSSSNGSSSSATSGIGSSTSSIATSSIAYGNGKHSTHGSIGAANGHFHGSFEFCSSLHHENSTRGIDVSTISPSGVGDLSVWDFSGCESYLQIYDHFLAETNCVHAILFRACDRLDIQMNQVLYWLHFLQSRLPVVEPLAFGGKSQFPAKVILIATHADLLPNRPNFHAYPTANNCTSTPSSPVDYVNREVATVYQVVMEKFSNIFDIHDQVLIMDSHAVGSQAMKQFKNYLSNVKNKILEILPPSSGLLESVISALNHWRKALSNFPILTYSQLVSMIREQINPLTGEEHVNQIVRQLVSIGEIFYLKSKNDQDLIVLCPKWLTSTVIGNLLCEDQLMKSPISGRYTVDEIQDLFPSMDALDLLQVLESLSLCTQCDSEGDFISKGEHKNIEYEFPYFIKQERPESPLLIADSLEEHHHHHAHHDNPSSPGPPVDGLESNNPNDTLMAGIRLQCDPDTPSGTLLTCLFPRLQTILRSLVQENNDIDNSLKLEQFCNTVKLHFGPLTATLMPAILSCSLQYEAIELRVVGPRSKPLDAFHFFYDLLSLIESSIGSMAPALLIHRHYMSPTELAKHKLHPLTYSPSQLIDVALRSSRPLEESLSITESSVLTTSLISSVSSSCSSSVSPSSETGRLTGIGERLADIISFGCNNLNFDMDLSTPNLSSSTPAATATSTNSAPTTLATNLAFAKSRDSYEFELRLNQTSGACIPTVPPSSSSIKSSSPSHHLFQPQFYQLPMTASIVSPSVVLPTINSNSSPGSTVATTFGPVSLNPTLVGELHINNLPVVTKQRLCALLDPPESMGKDWCMLGIKLGLTDKLPKLDPGNNTAISPTWRVLDECCRNPSCTISVLVAKLQELSRLDAVNLVLSSVPILKVFPLFSNMDSACPPLSDDASSAPISTVTRSASQASSSNLSR